MYCTQPFALQDYFKFVSTVAFADVNDAPATGSGGAAVADGPSLSVADDVRLKQARLYIFLGLLFKIEKRFALLNVLCRRSLRPRLSSRRS